MKLNNKISEQTLTGTSITNWFKLLWENKFKISLRYLPRAIFISFITLLTAPFFLLEKILFNRRIRNTKIDKPPIFIIGHWRSGTTFLHSLMIQNTDLAYVSNLQAFMPSTFISGGRLFKHLLKRLLPAKRRMDNIRLGIHEPQEEEYALANLSRYSIYHGIAFPQNLRYYSRYCSLDKIPEKRKRKWRKIYRRFLQKLTFHSKGKQLILKNPANTFRVKLLLEMFPNAKFIHIYRNPFEVFMSTWKMYHKMFPYMFLQKPFNEQEGKKFILDLYVEMFERFFKEKELIPKGNLIEISYEELTSDSLNCLEKIYQKLSLEGYENQKSNFVDYLEKVKNYQPSQYQIDSETELTIRKRWQLTIEKWGYNKLQRLERRTEKRIKRRTQTN